MTAELELTRGEEVVSCTNFAEIEDVLFGEAGGLHLDAFKTLLLCHKLLQQGKNNARRGMKFSQLVADNRTQQARLAASYHLFSEAQEAINAIVEKMEETSLAYLEEEE